MMREKWKIAIMKATDLNTKDLACFPDYNYKDYLLPSFTQKVYNLHIKWCLYILFVLHISKNIRLTNQACANTEFLQLITVICRYLHPSCLDSPWLQKSQGLSLGWRRTRWSWIGSAEMRSLTDVVVNNMKRSSTVWFSFICIVKKAVHISS